MRQRKYLIHQMKFNKQKNLIAVVGPTAIGKTNLSLQLARYFNTEIISADSRQFYKELKIGTAPPTPNELSEVKHHFIGNLSIHENYNINTYENESINLLQNLFKTYDNIIMVGGSGLYINALWYGIDELPDGDKSLRAELKNKLELEGIESLRSHLKLLDPEYYNQVDLCNVNRIIRAIEVCETTGKKFSDIRLKKHKKRDFNIIKIGLVRQKEELYAVINSRVDKMIENGLVHEVYDMSGFRQLNALNTVGYKELFKYIDGESTLTKAIEDIKTNTRRFAKRQMTWFRKDPSIKWFNYDEFNKIRCLCTDLDN